ncbi:MAG: cation transporting ATPase C-terminal domain-containing protein [Bryobacterales bacterium]|nr:cation transporting ATPase C-terminal domain-containing protein [Bryobacterales bacterium]
MWFFFAAKTPASQSLFQSGWFVEGLLSQTLIVHIIRTRKIPFIESSASAPLIFMAIFVMLIGLLLPYTPLGANFGLTPLPLAYYGWLLLILLGYVVLAQLVKNWFARKYGF